jgi:hypothetical protein
MIQLQGCQYNDKELFAWNGLTSRKRLASAQEFAVRQLQVGG